MNILAIETSCDETALSLLAISPSSQSADQVQCTVRSHIVLSQVDLHKEFGGVFPALAKREHAKNIVPLFIQSLKNAGLYIETGDEKDSDVLSKMQYDDLEKLLERETELYQNLFPLIQQIEKPDIDYICVTSGPGLEPALWVGIVFAKALHLIWGIPVVPVNHMEGHIMSVLAHGDSFVLQTPRFPILSLLISGGHTELVLVHDWMQYEKIGQTRDDAIGEAFDKVGRLLDLEYPGGPKVSQLARVAEGSPSFFKGGGQGGGFTLPRPMLHTDDFDFSFSGLKTAVRRLVEEQKERGTFTDEVRAQIALEFEESVTEVVLTKTKKALADYGIQTLIIAGGVAANRRIRSAFQKLVDEEFSYITLMIPDMALTGDNSLMIGVAGYFRIRAQEKNPDLVVPIDSIRAEGNMELTTLQG